LRELILEADGGSRGNPGPAAFGAVVRDAASGAVLAEIADYVGETTNNVAEYSGLVAGLRECARLDAGARVVARLDSKLVVEQMSGRWAVKNAALRDLVRAAHAAFPGEQVTYEWVPREHNTAADRLVNLALDEAAAGRSPLIEIRGATAGPAPATADVVGDAAPLVNKMGGWTGDLGVATTLLLARHGATEYSLTKRFSGSGGFDAPLHAVGEGQAQALAGEVLARGGVDVVVTSPLRRAQQTAAYVAAACGLEVVVVDGFAECAFGEWDGLTFAEVKEGWPREIEAWLRATDVAPPGGESFAECAARVDAARRDVVESYRGARIAVISHVTPIKLQVAAAIAAPLHILFRMELTPCSITTVAWYPDGAASMFGYGESGHLRGVASGSGV
jgi:probable phosphoglycerate mutase